MSRENVEIVRRAIEAFTRRDLDAVVQEYAPEVVVDWSLSPGVETGVYHGHAGARRLWQTFFDGWDRVTVAPEEFLERGEYVVVPNLACFWGRDGIKVEARGVFVTTHRDGLIVALRLYRDRAEALEAVGLSAS